MAESDDPRAAPPTEGGEEPAGTRPSSILLADKYRLLEEVGRGGMGTVFRARDLSLERDVAVKFLLPELQEMPDLVQRFAREARTLASVTHPGVVQLYDFGNYGGAPFFVMAYIEGETGEEWLARHLARGKLPPIEAALEILVATAEGLGAVHAAGVVHRDVKPGNVMIPSDGGQVVLMDFGIGRRYQPGDERRTLVPGGTPAYMAPEMAGGRDFPAEQEYLADVYALGVTIFELVSGFMPFEGGDWVDVLHKHMTEPPPTLSSRRVGVSPSLDGIVARCLTKEPAGRPQSCGEIAEELRQCAVELLDAREEGKRPTLEPGPGALPRLKGRGARIIVADSDPAFRAQLYGATEELLPGATFRAARSNASALDLARRAPPLALFAPLHDEALNGLELAAILSESSTTSVSSVVLTTDRITAKDRAMLDRMGVCEILVKPATEEEIRDVLAESTGLAPGCRLPPEE